ncbi:MAG: hypothetical protein ABJM06_09515 [Gilvibacter sp.]
MKKFFLVATFFLTAISYLHAQDRFDSATWKSSGDFMDVNGPRMQMVDDLIKNNLPFGMKKDSIVALLGVPFRDVVGKRLPTNVKLPDSLRFDNDEPVSREKRIEQLKLRKEWFDRNNRIDTVMYYFLGMTNKHLQYLNIRLNKKAELCEVWIESKNR